MSRQQRDGSCRSLSPKSMDRIVRMGRRKEQEPHVKYKTRMRDFAVALIHVYLFAGLHLIACILRQSIKPSLVFLIRKRLHATNFVLGKRVLGEHTFIFILKGHPM